MGVRRQTTNTVALLGRLHPVGVLLASVFFAILTIGTQSMHSGLGLPIALAQVLQVIVILVGAACSVLRFTHSLGWLPSA